MMRQRHKRLSRAAGRKAVPVPPMACPSCGEKLDQATAVSDPNAKPRAGDLCLCAGCGSFLRYGEGLRLEAIETLPSDLDPEEREALECAQLRVKGGAASYALCARMTHHIVHQWLVQYPNERPEFALPPSEIIAGLDVIGPRIAKNRAANDIVRVLVQFCVDAGMSCPTVIMLRAALEIEKVPVADASLGELGISLSEGKPS